MALKSELISLGMPPALASKLGYDPLVNIIAAGNSQATATPMVGNFANIASGTGGIIISERHAETLIINTSSATITIYPPVGAAMNNGTVNAGVTLTNTSRMSVKAAGLQFFTTTSA